MGRPRGQATRETVTITLDPELLSWVRQRAGAGRVYATLSHAVERGIVCLQEREALLERLQAETMLDHARERPARKA